MTSLRRARESKGLSQAATAALLNVSLSAYNRWERGAANPRFEDAAKMLAKLSKLRPPPKGAALERERAAATERFRFGEAMRRARVSAGWTQEELARAVGCQPSEISRHERGIILPDSPRLRAIRRTLSMRGAP